MGYTTEFSGHIECTPPLNEDEKKFLNAFAGTRKVIRRKANDKDGLIFIDGEDTGEILKGSYFTSQQSSDFYGQNTDDFYDAVYGLRESIDWSKVKDDDWEPREKIEINKSEEEEKEIELARIVLEKEYLEVNTNQVDENLVTFKL